VFQFTFLDSFNTHFDRADRTTGRGVSKNWMFWVLSDFFHKSILPIIAYLTINIFDKRIVWQSSLDVSIPTFWDLSCSSIHMFDWSGAQKYELWCVRCLLITKSPDAPCHYRYLSCGPLLHPLCGIEWCSVLRLFLLLCILLLRISLIRIFNAFGVGVAFN